MPPEPIDRIVGRIEGALERAAEDRQEFREALRDLDGKVTSLSLDFAQDRAVLLQERVNTQTQLLELRKKVDCLDNRTDKLERVSEKVERTVEKIEPVVEKFKFTKGQISGALLVVSLVLSGLAWLISAAGAKLGALLLSAIK